MEGRRTGRKREKKEGEKRRRKINKLRRKSETGGPERIIIHNHI